MHYAADVKENRLIVIQFVFWSISLKGKHQVRIPTSTEFGFLVLVTATQWLSVGEAFAPPVLIYIRKKYEQLVWKTSTTWGCAQRSSITLFLDKVKRSQSGMKHFGVANPTQKIGRDCSGACTLRSR